MHPGLSSWLYEARERGPGREAGRLLHQELGQAEPGASSGESSWFPPERGSWWEKEEEAHSGVPIV